LFPIFISLFLKIYNFKMKKFLFVLACLASSIIYSQSAKDAAVELSALVQTSPPTVTLSWVGNATTNSYVVARKLKNAAGWTTLASSIAGTVTQYVDNTVSVGTHYEYRVFRSGSGYTGYGYLSAGIEVPVVENRGKLILLVANTMTAPLAAEITRLENDLEGDGWQVIKLTTSPTASVSQVKAQIIATYSLDPTNTKALFILGPVPVPYSGNIVPDGHTSDHQGAWPADCFYGEMNGNWTDNSVTINVGPTRIHNVPGDGKYDQSYLPNDMELQVGRVDLKGMTSFTATETQLLKNYLDKDHAYRKKQFTVIKRGLMDDNFGYFSGESFASSGWNNLSAICTPSNVSSLDYITTMNSNSYQWSYGCGGGSYTSASGIGNTTNLSTSNLDGIFTMLFGSYFGDWDVNNNFLRAPLCQGKILTNAWSGRPRWFFHHMAMGDNIGYSTIISQNNNGTYFTPVSGFQRMIHMALMGDPSLRNDIVSPVSNVVATRIGNDAHITWTASTQTNVLGYNIYMKNDTNTSYIKINPTTISGTSYTHQCLVYPGIYKYMVRALVLEQSNGGSYFNMSEGIMDTALNTINLAIYASAGASVNPSGTVNFTASAIGGTTFAWSFGDGNNSSQQNPVHTYTQNGSYTATLVITNGCNSVSINVPVGISTGISNLELAEQIQVYPNPSSGISHVVVPSFITGNSQLNVYNQEGRVVYQSTVNEIDSEINLKTHAKGLYLLVIKTQSGMVVSKKIIIE